MSGIKYLLPLFLMFAGLSACDKDANPPKTLDCNLESPDYQTSQKSYEYQSLINIYTAKGLPGISLLMHDSTGYYIGSSGTADISNNTPMQPCHVQHFAGVTQMMTAVVLFKLQEKGQLSVDDLVSDYIPASTLKKIGNGDRPLKIRNLMNHSTGLYDLFANQKFDFELINDPTAQRSADQLLEYVYNEPALFAFGQSDTIDISHTNYLLLGMIIESATGMPVSKVITDEIIVPLGMNETYSFPHQKPPSNRLVKSYYDLYGNNTLHNLGNWNTGFGNGYNGIFSTVWDMHTFIEALFISQTLLQPASLEQMLQFGQFENNGRQIGLGCYQDFMNSEEPKTGFSWGYCGNGLAATAEIHYFPAAKTTLIVAVNYGTAKASNLRYTYNEFRLRLAALVREK